MAPIRQRTLRLLLLAALAYVCLPLAFCPPPLYAAAVTPAYDRAQQMREQLEAKPAPRRTRTDYTLVIDAYRVVYHGMPASPHAVDSILATAEVMEDEGRVFRDAKLFNAAISQYEYLRQQYPSNPRRAAALLAEAHVEQHDLRDPNSAEQKYRELIAHYPNSPEAAEAGTSLGELVPTPPPDHAAVTPQPEAQNLPPDSHTPAPDSHGKPSAAETTVSQNHTPVTRSMPATHNPVKHTAQVHIAASAANSSTDLLGASGDVSHHGGPPARLTGIRQLVTDDGVQLVFDLTSGVGFHTGRATNPTRLYFDLDNTHVDRALTLHPMLVSADPAQQWLVHRIRAAQFTANMTRVVLEVDDSADAYASLVPDPWRLMIDVHSVSPPAGSTPQQQTASQQGPAMPPLGTQPITPPATVPVQQPQYASQGQAAELPLDLPPTLNGVAPSTPAATTATNPAITSPSMNPAGYPANYAQATAAQPNSSGSSTLVRALGLKINRVVIDPGHGGRDTGTIGPSGLDEKAVVLDVALRLGLLLQQRGLQVVYTRTNDTFIPLEQRTAMANSAQGDLFISIHGNSSPETNVRGVETYYLSLTNQPDAMEVAARENATSAANIHDLSDIVKQITMNDKIDESRELATDVQQSLYAGLVSGNSGLKDRGIKKAPFIVLIGANMPSILTEISFLTDTKDDRELRDPKYRQRIAVALFNGISNYIDSLSGVRPSQPQSGKKKK